MEVVIEGKHLRLNQSDVIGAGGEGTVFRGRLNGDDLAVKVYHQPDHHRASKLTAFLSKRWSLPCRKIAQPMHLVYDANGRQIIGLTMPFLGQGFEELTSLANKKYRASFLVNTSMVAKIFVDGGVTVDSIHNNGLVIGDFNDLNGLFRGSEMLFIDVDAWQFDNFPCPVGTEQFLAPELYGIDLSQRAVFKPEHDWYSYAVMLFKSLLLVHPYGGTHKDVKQLTTRATRRITVFDSGVKYPKIALAPDLLDDDLADAFDRVFSKGHRGKFPIDLVRSYADSLVECDNCGMFYPHTRRQCPVCSAATLIIFTAPISVTKGVGVAEFLRTNGPIVFHKLVGTTLYVIAYENGKAVLYAKRGSSSPERKVLFDEIPGARYELVEDVLIVNLPGTTELLILDVSGNKPKPLSKTETEIFASNRRAVFRASARYLFRIVGGNIMYGEMQNGQLIERSLRQAMTNQTWFTVRQEETGNRPTACGFFQVMQQQMFWLVWEGQTHDRIPVSEMNLGESLIDLTVKFSSQGVLIRRLTQYQGVNYIRTDIIGTDGKAVYSTPRVREEDHISPSMHGHAYSTGKLLHATDEGVIQEDVVGSKVKTFDATKGYVENGDVLYVYQNGLLVVKDTNIARITLS